MVHPAGPAAAAGAGWLRRGCAARDEYLGLPDLHAGRAGRYRRSGGRPAAAHGTAGQPYRVARLSVPGGSQRRLAGRLAGCYRVGDLLSVHQPLCDRVCGAATVERGTDAVARLLCDVGLLPRAGGGPIGRRVDQPASRSLVAWLAGCCAALRGGRTCSRAGVRSVPQDPGLAAGAAALCPGCNPGPRP